MSSLKHKWVKAGPYRQYIQDTDPVINVWYNAVGWLVCINDKKVDQDKKLLYAKRKAEKLIEDGKI